MADPRPLRAVRVEEELWQAAKAQADIEGTTVSDHIRENLIQWTNKGETK